MRNQCIFNTAACSPPLVGHAVGEQVIRGGRCHTQCPSKKPLRASLARLARGGRCHTDLNGEADATPSEYHIDSGDTDLNGEADATPSEYHTDSGGTPQFRHAGDHLDVGV